MKNPERKTVTAPDGQSTGVVGAGDPVIGLRILDTNTEFMLPSQPHITVGADASCDIVVTSQFISSLHCVLKREQRGILLIDQGSKNGTRRGQHRADRFEVEDGVMFMLGTVPFMPFSKRTRERRAHVQRLIGYGESSQRQVDQFLRAMSGTEHVLLVGSKGSRRAELARLFHSAGKAPGAFIELDEVPASGSGQGHVLKSANLGTLFVHQEALPADSSFLLSAIRNRSYQIRLIAATDDEQRAPGKFGAELFNEMLVLRVPPLPDRRDEVPAIVRARIDEVQAARSTPTVISPTNLAALEAFAWTNMDELHEAVEWATVIARCPSVRAAAKKLGMPKSTLLWKMKRFGLKK